MSQPPPNEPAPPDPASQRTPSDPGPHPPPQQLTATERARIAAERAKAEAQVLLDRAEAARPRFKTLDAAFLAVDRDKKVAGSLLAGALAFRLFLVLLPMVLILVGGLGLSSDESLASAPRAGGMSKLVMDLVESSSQQSTTNQIVILGVGLVGFWFASRALVKGLRIIFALAWRLPPPRASQGVSSTLLAMGAIALVWLVSLLTGFLRGEVGLIGGLLLFLAVMGGVTMFVQWVMPHAEGVPWWGFVPGSLLQAIGMLAVQVATQFYLVAKAESYSEYYGGLGLAAVLLLWFYMMGRLMVGAVVYNAALWYRTQPQSFADVRAAFTQGVAAAKEVKSELGASTDPDAGHEQDSSPPG